VSEPAAALLVGLAVAGAVLLLLLCVALLVALAQLGRVLVRPRVRSVPAAPARPVAPAARRRRTPPRRATPSGREALAVWRYRQLLQLEVDPLTAAQAALAGIDAASVRSLIELGCPVELALAIVAPDERAVPAGATRSSR